MRCGGSTFPPGRHLPGRSDLSRSPVFPTSRGLVELQRCAAACCAILAARLFSRRTVSDMSHSRFVPAAVAESGFGLLCRARRTGRLVWLVAVGTAAGWLGLEASKQRGVTAAEVGVVALTPARPNRPLSLEDRLGAGGRGGPQPGGGGGGQGG